VPHNFTWHLAQARGIPAAGSSEWDISGAAAIKDVMRDDVLPLRRHECDQSTGYRPRLRRRRMIAPVARAALDS
jgi:hypothetical protein